MTTVCEPYRARKEIPAQKLGYHGLFLSRAYVQYVLWYSTIHKQLVAVPIMQYVSIDHRPGALNVPVL